jgi:sugar lactone lactonase YvrE
MNRRAFLAALAGTTLAARRSWALDTSPDEKLVPVRRVPWLPETRCLEMFSAMTQGPDGRVYAGTCNAEKLGACLISFDPRTGRQEKLADMQEACGEAGAKTLPQSKIHSQVHFDRTGTAWFGTHSYDWNTLDQYLKSPTDYSGGHLVTYAPRTRKTTDLGILVPHESIMSLALAESAGKVYCALHPTGRFVVYDIAARKLSDKGIVLGFPSRITVALKDGRGYTFTLQGDVVRYDPRADCLEKLPVSVPLFPGETDRTHNNPFDLAVSRDEKRIYGVGWTSGLLFEYRPDDGPDGSIRSLGPAFGDDKVPGVRKSLNIAIKEGRDGRIYYAGYYENRGRLACYDPKSGERRYLGRMVSDGKPIGTQSVADGTSGAMCVLREGTVVVADFDNHQTYFNLFHPRDLK